MAEPTTELEPPNAKQLCRRRRVWHVTVGLFFLLAVSPLWTSRFPPMQDYPQHLMMSHMLRHWHDPAFDYPQYFDIRIHPAYATFHLITLAFSYLVPVETAGKLTLSLYPVLVAVLVLRLGRRLEKDGSPWGALLFFPLAFNQQYFLGNENYFLALPLLVMALLDYEDFLAVPLGAWSAVRLFFWEAVVFVTHPFAFLIFASLAGVAAIVKYRQTEKWIVKVLVSTGGAVVLFLLVWLWNQLSPAVEKGANEGVAWLSPRTVLEFFTMMFTGMKNWSQASIPDVVLWVAVFAVVVAGAVGDWSTRKGIPRLYLIWLAVGFVALFALPFRMILFTFINLRVVAAVYFLLALVAAQVRFGKRMAPCLVGLLGVCMVLSLIKQSRISAEVNEIAPLFAHMRPNARVLPLVFDNDSPELDSAWFDIHLHDHNYYHVLVGGGFNPYLSHSPLIPAHYKPGAMRPAPGEYRAVFFSRQLDAADYDYFLLRAAPPGAPEYVGSIANQVAVSGKWMLFERKQQ